MEKTGYRLSEKDYLGEDFANHMDVYLKVLRSNKDNIVNGFGKRSYDEAEKGILAWLKAARENKVGRGLWIAKKVC